LDLNYWTTGMDDLKCTGLLQRTIRTLDYWSTGMDYWTTGIDYWSTGMTIKMATTKTKRVMV